jgi:hypothetical protein
MGIYRLNEDHSVTYDGTALNPRTDIYNHSPTGFNWGYAGSGPAQLALAIMVNEYGEDLTKHPIHYQDFKRDFIEPLDSDRSYMFKTNDITSRVLKIQWKD